MELYSLLEKRGKIQISIIRYLLDHNLTASHQAVIDDLKISSFLFKTNVEELEVVLGEVDVKLALEIDWKQEQLRLHKSNQTDLDALYYYYLNTSNAYRLLVYLYWNQNYTIYDLAVELSLSEAVVYRLINKLNTLLKEFHIKIWRGKIIGSESQICYFFFLLFWNASPLCEIQKKVNDQTSLRFVGYLEKLLKQNFTEVIRVKLYLWIRVIQTRGIQANMLEHKHQEIDLDPDQLNDPIYHSIRDAYFLVMSHSATFGSEYKATYLYLFVSTMFVLDPFDHELMKTDYWPTYNHQVITLNEMVVNHVKTFYNIRTEQIDSVFVTNWKYYLSQIHSRMLFFKGNITFFDDQVLYERFIKSMVYSPNLKLAQTIVTYTESILGFPLLESSRQLSTRIYTYFINQMQQFSQKRIIIGVFCNRDNLQTNMMVDNIRREFDTKFYIKVEEAVANKSYDLLVADSDFALDIFTYQELYIINDFKTATDTTALTELLHRYSQKEGN